MNNTITKLIIGGVVIVLLLTVFNPFKIVPEGSRGLRFNLGKIEHKVLDPGLQFRVPFFQSISVVKITPMVVNTEIRVNSAGAITKDNQTVGAEVKVFYKYKSDKLVEMWSKFGTDRVIELVTASIMESFKITIGDYDIFSIPVSQDEIRDKVLKTISLKMEAYPVDITDVNILNYDWSDSFDTQITETMNRAQQVKQKEQELLITQQESLKKVKEAEADKQALIFQAEGEKEAARLRAEAKSLEGEGIKKYNQSVQANMDLELKIRALEIEKIKAEKWNGQYVPNNMYGPIPVDTKGGVKQ